MRREGQAVGYLDAVGLRNATVIIEAAGRQTTWQIPEFDVDLQHKQKRSIVSGRIRVATAGEPWLLTFRAEDSEKAKSIILETRFEGLVPRDLARQLPQIPILDGLDIPMSGKGLLDVTLDGAVTSGRFEIDLGQGSLQMPGLSKAVIGLDKGRIALSYTGATRSFILEPSPLSFGSGQVTLTGRIAPLAERGISGAEHWGFDVRSEDGRFAGNTPGQPAIAIDQLIARGRYGRSPGQLELDALSFKAGGAEIEMAAAVGGAGQTVMEGRISPMSIATLKSIWPTSIAPRARAFFAERLTKGQIKAASFKIAAAEAGTTGERRLALAIEGSDLEIEVYKGLPPVDMPRALLRVDGTSLEVTVPDASLTATGGRKISFKNSRFTAVDIDGPNATAEIALRGQGPLLAALEILDREPIGLGRSLGLPAGQIDGRVELQLRATLPLAETLTLADARIEGKARITDGRFKNVIGTHDITGATVLIEGTEKTVDIKGEMLLAGVHAKLQGRVATSPGETKAPTLKLSIVLDDNDRAQLGLELDRLVRGAVPIEITASRAVGEPTKVHVVADLAAAELMLDEIHWRKPVGRPAKLEFDIGKGPSAKGFELQNFKLDSEKLAIDGWVSIGPDNKAREFFFPEFLVNVVSNVEIQGILRPDRVWEVKARGKTPFDAGDIFRSMFALNQDAAKPTGRDRPGLDLSAEFDTVLGVNDTRIKQVRIKAQKRNDQLSGVDFRAVLEGGRPLTAVLRPEAGRPRVLRVETSDAGQALKLIGFYPNMVGGTGTLDINLDGRGAVEKTGQLSVRSFRVLGDPIASEVFYSPDESQPAIANARVGRRVLREQFDFESLQAGFVIGNGQLLIDNAIAKGPLIGASISGKIDFRTQRLQLGGTYVPLSGLSRALSGIPVLSELLTGPRGEGMLGITFAVEGAMANPQVIVNPFSPLAIGVLRELTQMSPQNPSITPRTEPVVKAPKGAGPQIRSSPPAEARPGAASKPRVEPELLDPWSTTLREPGALKK